MQPDPLSPQQDDKQPESLSEPLPVSEEFHVEPTPIQEIVKIEPSPIQEKKRARPNIAAIVLGLLAFILLATTAGLGYWGYKLNAKLATTQQQLAVLQGDHDKLQADYAALTNDKEKLNTDLTQAKADLEKTNADLAAAQADLKTSQDQTSGLQTKVATAGKKSEILYAFSIGKTAQDIFTIDSMIKATNDQQLLTQWNKFVLAPSADSSVAFLNYLIDALRKDLK